jgi:hypothetical protein
MAPSNFSAHSVFEKLEQFKQFLQSEAAKIKIEIENYSFFESAHLYIQSRLRTTIPVLITDAEMNALSSEIEAASSQLNSFVGNSNVGHVNNAVNNINSALSRVRNFPTPLSSDDFDFAKAVSYFQATVNEAYERLNGVNQNLQKELEASKQVLTTRQNQLTELEKKITEKEVELQNLLTKQATDFENVKSVVNTSIENDRKGFTTKFNEDRSAYKTEIDTLKTESKKAFDAQLDNAATRFDGMINDLNGKLKEANKIVNIIGNVGVTGNYQRIANDHDKTADNLRFGAIGFMVVMSGLLIWSIYDLSTNGFDLYKSLVRILATKNRNLELELASIGPFIELLSEDQKTKIKIDLVSKYFGNHSNAVDDKEQTDDVSVNALDKILKTILPFVKK